MAIFDVKVSSKSKKSKNPKFKSLISNGPKGVSKISFIPKAAKKKPKVQNLIFGFDIPKKKPKKKIKGKKAMDWFQAKKKFPKLSPFGDADKDGIQNWLDCRPFNKKRQAWDIKSRKKEGFKVSYMRPRTYLRKTKTDPWSKKPEEAEYAKGLLETYYDTETDKGEPIEKLSGYIKDPKKKITTPFVGYKFSSLGTEHEGRHRAYAAALAGKKKIPVVVPTPEEWKSRKVVEKFIEKRFPHATEDYKEEWRGRFIGPFPQDRMDEETLMAYKEVLAEEGIEPKKKLQIISKEVNGNGKNHGKPKKMEEEIIEKAKEPEEEEMEIEEPEEIEEVEEEPEEEGEEEEIEESEEKEEEKE